MGIGNQLLLLISLGPLSLFSMLLIADKLISVWKARKQAALAEQAPEPAAAAVLSGVEVQAGTEP